MSSERRTEAMEDKQGEEEDLALSESLPQLSNPLLHPQSALTVPDQKRNPHKIEEGTKWRIVAEGSETPTDQKNLHLVKIEEHSCTPTLPQDEPGVGGPITSPSIP
jgi:hypothetical protein